MKNTIVSGFDDFDILNSQPSTFFGREAKMSGPATP